MKKAIISVLRIVIGLGLLPLCVIAIRSLLQLILLLQNTSDGTVPPDGWALISGFLLWIAVFLMLPRPARSYVLAHELTHALWASLCGERVMGIRVNQDSGSVLLSRSNFLITLAPYFFPLYTVLVIAAHCIITIFFDLGPYRLYILGLIAFTWGFHFTFTIHTLLQHQSDIRECGYLFSYTFIFFMNLVGIVLWVLLVSPITSVELLHVLHAQGNTVWSWIINAASLFIKQ
ncbi:MAG: M50 family metallopeptidase [Kiritimatiellae bacterium]|nr:M50 family metallopeptidase [Kiritimatiellia bacterium]